MEIPELNLAPSRHSLNGHFIPHKPRLFLVEQDVAVYVHRLFESVLAIASTQFDECQILFVRIVQYVEGTVRAPRKLYPCCPCQRLQRILVWRFFLGPYQPLGTDSPYDSLIPAVRGCARELPGQTDYQYYCRDQARHAARARPSYLLLHRPFSSSPHGRRTASTAVPATSSPNPQPHPEPALPLPNADAEGGLFRTSPNSKRRHSGALRMARICTARHIY
ncbi:hypothetical protein ES703_47564 [subsurface metagenome]